MQSGFYSPLELAKKQSQLRILPEPTPPLQRMRGRTKRLSVSERLDVAHQVLVHKDTLANVARSHRVTISTVYKTMKRLKEDPNYFSKHITSTVETRELRNTVAEFVQEMINRNDIIDSVKSLTSDLN